MTNSITSYLEISKYCASKIVIVNMVVKGGQNIQNNMGCRHIDCFKNRYETQSIQKGLEKVLLIACTLAFQNFSKNKFKLIRAVLLAKLNYSYHFTTTRKYSNRFKDRNALLKCCKSKSFFSLIIIYYYDFNPHASRKHTQHEARSILNNTKK